MVHYTITLQIFILFSVMCMCMCLYVGMCMYMQLPVKARRQRQIPWSWSSWEVNTEWALHAFNYWEISPASTIIFWWEVLSPLLVLECALVAVENTMTVMKETPWFLERKHLIGACLAVLEGWSVIIMVRSRLAWHCSSSWELYILICRQQAERGETSPVVGFWNFKAHFSNDTSSSIRLHFLNLLK